MKNKIIKTISLFISSLFLSLPLISSSCWFSNKATSKFVLQDMSQNPVSIYKKPEKIACQSRSAFDMLLAFGLKDKIDGIYNKTLGNKWLTTFFKDEIKNYYPYSYNETIETYFSRKVDLVIVFEESIKKNLLDKKIDAITINQYDQGKFNEESLYVFPKLLANLFEGKTKELAKKWIDETKQLLAEIKSKIANLSFDKKMFYLRSDQQKKQIRTESSGSLLNFIFKFLHFSASEITNDKPSEEEFIKVNPDYLLLGGQYQDYMKDWVNKDPKFSSLNFAKNNSFINIPIGVSAFEQLSVETPILIAHLANVAYPSLFNFDIKQMIKDCYKTYFNFDLTNEQIDLIYNGKTEN
ncbi:ABC transporter substrate-binding protein [Mycoplasmopsis hyopharyngis]|uniref:ABC transporter substrate-binding protein n=1 Tax=Mycoplasmopsis hyopharyngis TaxID=29558 RepID=UPI003872F2E3